MRDTPNWLQSQITLSVRYCGQNIYIYYKIYQLDKNAGWKNWKTVYFFESHILWVGDFSLILMLNVHRRCISINCVRHQYKKGMMYDCLSEYDNKCKIRQDHGKWCSASRNPSSHKAADKTAIGISIEARSESDLRRLCLGKRARVGRSTQRRRKGWIGKGVWEEKRARVHEAPFLQG